MLNDSQRNLSFKRAVQHWIRKEGKVDVMDIGSGTGILSMYAANVASVRSIHAIECSPIMCQISTEVFKANVRGKFVSLVAKHSMDLKVGEDVPSKASLIVSETLDSGIFGEGILDTLIHAKQHLLEPDGKIVPWKVKVHVSGYKSKSLSVGQVLLNDSFHEYLFLDNFRLVGKRDEPYDAECVDQIEDFELVTDTVDTLEVDFNDLQSMQQHFDGTAVKAFQLQSNVRNFLDGFVAWFTLYMNELDPENFISTEPRWGSCWNQAIFKLNKRVLLHKHQVLKLSMSCKDGVLRIHHELDVAPGKVDLEVDSDVLRFLNDDEYLRELEFAVSKHKSKVTNCLDLSPFPYVGLVLLKDCRVEKLWCQKKDEQLIRSIASKNLIHESSLEFFEEADVEMETKFQLILLHLFHPLGDLDNLKICEYPTLKSMLSPGGLMIPHKITLFGELIHSEWLADSCRITDVGIKRLKIDRFMNKYATDVHLDLDDSLQCERLTSIFKISEIFFDDQLHETTVGVPMRKSLSQAKLPIQAIFYQHKIQLTISNSEFMTSRKGKFSSFKRCAQFLPKEIFDDGNSVTVSFTQNSGVIKCDVEG